MRSELRRAVLRSWGSHWERGGEGDHRPLRAPVRPRSWGQRAPGALANPRRHFSEPQFSPLTPSFMSLPG